MCVVAFGVRINFHEFKNYDDPWSEIQKMVDKHSFTEEYSLSFHYSKLYKGSTVFIVYNEKKMCEDVSDTYGMFVKYDFNKLMLTENEKKILIDVSKELTDKICNIEFGMFTYEDFSAYVSTSHCPSMRM